jgi:hypothetical protein
VTSLRQAIEHVVTAASETAHRSETSAEGRDVRALTAAE